MRSSADLQSSPAAAACAVQPLESGWEAAWSAPDEAAWALPPERLTWHPARVPGTGAAMLHDAGLWRPGEACDLDASDWWFRTTFDAEAPAPGEELVLCLDGIATVAEVHLNGERLLAGDSMFERHAVDVGARLRGRNELLVRCRALAPLLHRRRRPRARWRTRLVADGNLRFFRTTLLGRAPGFAPGPAAVGPWRPVRLERRRRLAVSELQLRARLEGDDGVLEVTGRLRALDAAAPALTLAVELTGPSGTHAASLTVHPTGDGAVAIAGELRVPAVARWWPHTHGAPDLHAVRLLVAGDGEPLALGAGRVGFRSLAPGPPGHDVEADGLDLRVNQVPVFARGAVWMPADPVGLAPSDAALRRTLERLRDAGMNMVRVPGTAAYESDAFYDLCDELGLLVWQDFMFANLDYPIADDDFRACVRREAADVLARLGGRASLAVLCGNSEIEQQVAMLGLDPELGRGPLFGELLPALVRDGGGDAVYVPSAPCGGDLPFRPDGGVANYYGVGGYRRPLEDVRRAGVRFAAECLAFANVPGEDAVEAILPGAPGDVVVHHPRWKAGVPRDAGAGWDFDDVRDHYLAQRFGVDPAGLRRYDHERYLELSRAVTGETMAEVFGEWRREGSPCGGALVLSWRDLAPGAGWGLLDHRGDPKVAYHHLRRALAPVALWTIDEGLGGVGVHLANDRPERLEARLRVALYRDLEQCVETVVHDVCVPAHGAWHGDVEALLGRFVDVGWAYRFGPPGHDATVISLERDGVLMAQAMRFPAGPPLAPERPDRLGLQGRSRPEADGTVRLTVSSGRLAYGVRIHVPGYEGDDDAFNVEPGGRRTILLRPARDQATFGPGALTALNLAGRVRIEPEATPA